MMRIMHGSWALDTDPAMSPPRPRHEDTQRTRPLTARSRAADRQYEAGRSGGAARGPGTRIHISITPLPRHGASSIMICELISAAPSHNFS